MLEPLEPQHVEVDAGGVWQPAYTVPTPGPSEQGQAPDRSWVLLTETGSVRCLPATRVRQPAITTPPPDPLWKDLALSLSPYVTHFDDDTPLYPGITAKWQALAEDTQAQQQLQRLPQRLRRLLVEEGQVQMCTPLTAAGQGTPAPVPLQLVALRAAHLAAGTNLVLDEGQWAQVLTALQLPEDYTPGLETPTAPCADPGAAPGAAAAAGKRSYQESTGVAPSDHQQQQAVSGGSQWVAGGGEGSEPSSKRQQLLPRSEPPPGRHQQQQGLSVPSEGPAAGDPLAPDGAGPISTTTCTTTPPPAPPHLWGAPITSASSLQPGQTVVLREEYPGGLLVVRHLLLVRPVGRGGWARVWAVQQLSYKEVRGHQQQQQQEEEGQVPGASNSSSASSSATFRMAQDRVAVHYMDKGEKKWVQAAPRDPGDQQRLALKVALGWHELDAQQRQQVDETPYAFAAMQLATLRKEVAMCQLANSEYVVAAYGVGIMHGTPASPNPTSATTAAAAAAATAADPAPSTPPAASAAATPAAPAGAGKHRVSQQLPVAAMLMERASCSLSHYIQQPHGATGAGDAPSVAALGLRHSPQLRDEAKDLLCQLIRALRKLEHLNVLHRDIKSENLLLFKSAAASPSAHSGASPSAAAGAASGAPSSPAAEAAPAAGGPAAAGKRSRWHLKLADFGVAWQGSTARPRAKSMGGTPGFLTPEATSNFQSDNSSNTYWVALVLLEMLFGRPPMWYRDITDVGEYIVLCMEIDDPNTPYGGPGGLTGADQQFLRKCLVIEAMDRPMLVQLLQDPAVKAYLGWPEQWGLVRD